MLTTSHLSSMGQELGLRLRKARIIARKTQQELGTMAGISARGIGRMERRDTSVSLAKWLAVSLVLGLDATWQDTLQVRTDPFDEYDRARKETLDLKKKRVRHSRK